MATRLIFEFRCENCDTVDDRLVPSDTYEVSCAVCGNPAKRIISPVRIDWRPFVHGPNASQPAIDKWDKIRRQKMDIEQKKLENHGTYD